MFVAIWVSKLEAPQFSDPLPPGILQPRPLSEGNHFLHRARAIKNADLALSCAHPAFSITQRAVAVREHWCNASSLENLPTATCLRSQLNNSHGAAYLKIVTPSHNISQDQDKLPRACARGCELRNRSRLRLNRKPIEGHNHRALPLVRAGAWRLADIWPNAGIDSRFGLIAGNCPHPSFTITSG